jgi:hypothetical protein
MAEMNLINDIHRVEQEIEECTAKIKTIKDDRKSQIEELPECKDLQGLTNDLKVARELLKGAIEADKDISTTSSELSEYKFKLNDLKEILSHNLVIYFRDTGREVVEDFESTTRQIVIKAKLGAKALDQESLPFEEVEA